MNNNKVYIVCNNYGYFLSNHDRKSIDWTSLDSCAETFKTYTKAYSVAKSISNRIGCYCSVIRLKQEDYKPLYWDQFVKESK